MLTDLRNTPQGMRYIGCLVVNASPDVVTLKDNAGREFPVQAGQPADCDLEPGMTSIWLTATSAIAAGAVTLIPRVKHG